jgi:hypothetical protein
MIASLRFGESRARRTSAVDRTPGKMGKQKRLGGSLALPIGAVTLESESPDTMLLLETGRISELLGYV